MNREKSGFAVVVGATGTMGSAVVHKFVERGIPILAVARNKDKLAELATHNDLITTCAADIGQNISIEQIGKHLKAPVRMAVFAAGLPVRGSVETMDPDSLALGANIKLRGVVRLLRAVKGHFQEQHARFVVCAGSHGVEPTALEAGPGAINAGLFNLM